jgi:FKBP-type peptidyl-prolyl cis-trans isomerase 2
LRLFQAKIHCVENLVATPLARFAPQLWVHKLQTFLLSADEAFGQADGAAIQVMNRAEFPKALGIELNNGVEFKTPTGDSYVGCIDKIDGDDITVNFNHPLAGCDVSFQVEILEKSKSPQ